MNAIMLHEQSQIATTGKDFATITEAVNLFLSESDIKDSSRNTYKKALRNFFEYVQYKGVATSAINAGTIQAFKDEHLQNGTKSRTICVYLTAIRLFYSWLEGKSGNGFVFANVAKSVRNPKIKHEFVKEHLEPQDVTRLLDHVRETRSARDYAIINLMVRGGLRCVEVARLNIESLGYERGRNVLNIQGKGRTEADEQILLTEKALQPIREYLTTCRRGAAESEPLFCGEGNRNRDRLTTRTISRIIKTALREIGIDSSKYTAHSLRHTCAVSILKATNGDVFQVQKVLRHSNPATTQIYLKSVEKEQRYSQFTESVIDKLY